MKHWKAPGGGWRSIWTICCSVAGGACFVRAAWELGGRPAALLVAGGCLVAYAVVIAKARRGGRR